MMYPRSYSGYVTEVDIQSALIPTSGLQPQNLTPLFGMREPEKAQVSPNCPHTALNLAKASDLALPVLALNTFLLLSTYSNRDGAHVADLLKKKT